MRNIPLAFQIIWNLTEININSYFLVNSIVFDRQESGLGMGKPDLSAVGEKKIL